MNKKLSFQNLAELLSAATGQPVSFSEDFIKELFIIVADTLVTGEPVNIKGLGEFIPGTDSSLTFNPASVLADRINAPFSHFSPEKLRPDITEAALEEVAAVESPATAEADDCLTVSRPIEVVETEIQPAVPVHSETLVETIPVTQSTPEVIEVIETHIESSGVMADSAPEPQPEFQSVEIIPIEEDEEEIFEEKKPGQKQSELSSTIATITPEEAKNEPDISADGHETQPEPDESRSGGFGLGFFIGLIVGLAVGAAAMFFYVGRLSPEPVVDDEYVDQEGLNETYHEAYSENLPAASDSVPSQPVAKEEITEPAATAAPQSAEAPSTLPPAASASAAVTDKVRAGYLMPKMAQKHYGNQVFWVYIYEENKAKISNPNNLPAGLELVIPPANKYGIDASDSKSVSRAQAKENEIWNKK